MNTPNKINVEQKLSLFSDHWNPRIIAELNGQHIKLAKIKGEFVWHSHENEDELFMVLKGDLTIEFRDKRIQLSPGEIVVIPKGIEHKPVTQGEVEIMLFEPVNTVNTGATGGELKREKLDWI
jgi:mannose-6-phosphate isomerase-like protein (cupin superfamily)